MLTSLNLKSHVGIDDLQAALTALTGHMLANDFMQAISPVGRRCKHPVMDTDSERDHEFYFLLTFLDREQCDRAVKHIFGEEKPGVCIHQSLIELIEDPVFTCWEDIPASAGFVAAQ